MNQNAIKFSQFFYLITTFLILFFPKQTIGNIVFLICYLLVCLILLYLIFFNKSKK